jgi:2,4-dienoyl-CoA reductase [(3E)-enoyl-CoA-producing], peroxisomal
LIIGAARLAVMFKNPNDSKEHRNYHKETPLQRVGHIDDVANATVFLFSEAANFITGQIFVVDGASEHLRQPQLPYPESLLDPKSVESVIKAKM